MIQIFCILLAAATGQADQAPGVELDAEALGLDEVVDREELQYEERDAYFGILLHLQEVDPRALEQAAAQFRRHRWSTVSEYGELPEEEFPVFVDLFQHPPAYRGKPVTLTGHIIGPIIPLPEENEFGLDLLYQAHLYDVHAQSNPATIVFTELPAGIDLEADMIDGVSVTGYFFKIDLYRSRAGHGQLAPLVLARSIEVRAPAPPEWPVSQGAMISLILAVAVSALMVVLYVTRRDRGVMRDYRRRFAPEPQFQGVGDPGSANIVETPQTVASTIRTDNADLVRRTGMRNLWATVGWCLASVVCLLLGFCPAILALLGAIVQLVSSYRWLANTQVLDEQEFRRWKARLRLLTALVTIVGLFHVIGNVLGVLQIIAGAR